jgi:hypothetical protein
MFNPQWKINQIMHDEIIDDVALQPYVRFKIFFGEKAYFTIVFTVCTMQGMNPSLLASILLWSRTIQARNQDSWRK